MVIGRYARVYSSYSMALGLHATVYRNSSKSISIGDLSEIRENSENSSVLGGSSKILADSARSSIFGSYSKINSNSGSSVIVGANATIYNNSSESTAIGYMSNVSENNPGAVALGSRSVANRTAGVEGFLANGKTDKTWKSTQGALSIGSYKDTRQIINVAAGSSDTDAVNVAQLKRMKSLLEDNLTYTAGEGILVKNNIISANINNMKGIGFEKNKMVIKLGSGLEFGNDGRINVKDGFGDLSNYLKKDEFNKYLKDNIAAGDNITLTEDTEGRVVINGEKGGNDLTAGKNINIENGKINLNEDINLNSVTAKDINADTANIGDISINKDNKGTINGLTNTIWDKDNYISGQAATEDQIKHVDDRVDVVEEKVVNNEKNISNLSNRIGNLSGEIKTVGAKSAALSALKPIQYDPENKSQIMAGFGAYRGNQALALGMGYYFNERTFAHLGGSFSTDGNHPMWNVGVTFKFGAPRNKSLVRYQTNASFASLQQKNIELEEKVNVLIVSLEEERKNNEELRERLTAIEEALLKK